MKHNNTEFTLKEQFIIMLVFLFIAIISVTIAYCSVSQNNNRSTVLNNSDVMLTAENSVNEIKNNEISTPESSVQQSQNIIDNEQSKTENKNSEITTVDKERTENKIYAETFYKTATKQTNHHIENFPSICQFPELPTGCEAVSLTSVLNYWGFDVSMTDIADNYLPKNGDLNNLGDFRYEFLGNPSDWSGFGCFPPCIETTAYNYFNEKNITDYISVDITGATPQELYNLVAQDIPIIVWVTTRWEEPYVDASWEGINGETISWLWPEHCLVLVGYDKENNNVVVSDVDVGYEYDVSMTTFESVYTNMGSNAVIIIKAP